MQLEIRRDAFLIDRENCAEGDFSFIKNLPPRERQEKRFWFSILRGGFREKVDLTFSILLKVPGNLEKNVLNFYKNVSTVSSGLGSQTGAYPLGNVNIFQNMWKNHRYYEGCFKSKVTLLRSREI